MTFQASDNKEHQFLELLNNDNKPLKPTYSKGRSWLKYFGYFTSLCMRAKRAIVNYAPISKYWLRFFPQKEFKCLCRTYPIETRRYILFDWKRYNKYWNLRRDTISHFTLLEFNSSMSSFRESITWPIVFVTLFSLHFFFSFFLYFFSLFFFMLFASLCK